MVTHSVTLPLEWGSSRLLVSLALKGRSSEDITQAPLGFPSHEFNMAAVVLFKPGCVLQAEGWPLGLARNTQLISKQRKLQFSQWTRQRQNVEESQQI